MAAQSKLGNAVHMPLRNLKARAKAGVQTSLSSKRETLNPWLYLATALCAVSFSSGCPRSSSRRIASQLSSHFFIASCASTWSVLVNCRVTSCCCSLFAILALQQVHCATSLANSKSDLAIERRRWLFNSVIPFQKFKQAPSQYCCRGLAHTSSKMKLKTEPAALPGTSGTIKALLVVNDWTAERSFLEIPAPKLSNYS
jgi:hypothetical protein